MNGLSTVVAVLTTESLTRRHPESGSRTAALRGMLLDGPATSMALSAGSGLSKKLVRSLLKHDIQNGRVLVRQGIYCLSPDYDAAEPASVRRAKTLLQRHGYSVEKALVDGAMR